MTPMYQTPRPDEEDIDQWLQDGEAEALDGCTVEPDGYCEHGHPSWLIELGIV